MKKIYIILDYTDGKTFILRGNDIEEIMEKYHFKESQINWMVVDELQLEIKI